MMGIINVTPDSFSDGGQALEIDNALNKASELLEQGVDILDLGAESTRPGSEFISAEIESARLLPVLRTLRKKFPHVPLSIDTYKASVAKSCLEEGADIINDVEGARYESRETDSPMARL
ncbi:MAG: dihydropteroate synthase [Proteobacteria bacterium]|nr:dihydropteroate synthase [Pseudomonadota bacterium]